MALQAFKNLKLFFASGWDGEAFTKLQDFFDDPSHKNFKYVDSKVMCHRFSRDGRQSGVGVFKDTYFSITLFYKD